MSDYPLGVRLTVDTQTDELPDGMLLGGSPRRLLRLSAAGMNAYAALKSGPVATPAQASLARKLTDAGVLHPIATRTRLAATVVIPVRDRADALDTCLLALGSAYPVLVVDDGSTEPALVANVCAQHGATLLARAKNGGPAAARNTGLAAVETEFVLLLDSDCVPPAGLIDALAGHLVDPQVAAVAPRMMGDAGHLSPLDLGPHSATVGPGRPVSYVPTAALLLRRAVLPPFDESLRYGEDVDLVWKLIEAGHRVRYEPSVLVIHAEPKALATRLRRRFHYGTSAAPLALKHPGAVPALVVHPWSMLVVAGALLRRPILAAAGLLGSYRELRSIPFGRQRRALVGRSAWLSWLGLSRATAQFALPIVLVVAARRRLALVALVSSAPLATWIQRRGEPRTNPIRFTAEHVAGDAAYGLGVLVGCARTGCFDPLQPIVTRAFRRATT